jgi:hypothetical protein
MADVPTFLGRGFGFPPTFAGGQVRMAADEQDIHESLLILFGTRPGERVLQPKASTSRRCCSSPCRPRCARCWKTASRPLC